MKNIISSNTAPRKHNMVSTISSIMGNEDQVQCLNDSNSFESGNDPIWMTLNVDFNATCIINDNDINKNNRKEICTFGDNIGYKALCEDKYGGRLFIIDNVIDCNQDSGTFASYKHDKDVSDNKNHKDSKDNGDESNKERPRSIGDTSGGTHGGKVTYYKNNPFCLGRSCTNQQVHEWINEMIDDSLYYSDCTHIINHVSLYGDYDNDYDYDYNYSSSMPPSSSNIEIDNDNMNSSGNSISTTSNSTSRYEWLLISFSAMFCITLLFIIMYWMKTCKKRKHHNNHHNSQPHEFITTGAGYFL
jgi:hypothetical protein